MPKKPKAPLQPNPIERKSWGGPAKGPGNGSPRADPLVGHASRIGGDAFKYMQKKERVEKLREMLFNIAETAEGEMVRVSAINGLWNREEGVPKPAADTDTSNTITITGGLPEDG